ncbi:MAG: SpoIIE family protein phosphatase [Bacteroidota bacterium]
MTLFTIGRFCYFDRMAKKISGREPAHILIRGSRAADQPAMKKNILTGIAENVKHSDSVVKFFPGDRIVFCTDGLVEVFNPRGKLFGKTRLLTLLAKSVNLPGEKISELLIHK